MEKELQRSHSKAASTISSNNDQGRFANKSQLPEKKIFDFKIAGVSYKIKSSHSEETVSELVRYVNEKVMVAQSLTKNSSFQNAAVLAALNIAEEYILLKKKAHKELLNIEEKAIKLCQKLENSKVDENNS